MLTACDNQTSYDGTTPLPLTDKSVSIDENQIYDDVSNDPAFSEFRGEHVLVNETEYAYDGVPGLFSTHYPFSEKVLDVLERHNEEMQDPEKYTVVHNWLDTLEQYRGQNIESIFSAVNKEVNLLLRYVRDTALYGKIGHHATPYETLTNRRGDCEDFAILKYVALLHLGVPEDRIRITRLKKRNTEKPVIHCNLLVEGVDGKQYFLDDDQAEADSYRLIPAEDYTSFDLQCLTNSSPAALKMMDRQRRKL